MQCCGATGFRDYSGNILIRQNKMQDSQAIDMTLSRVDPSSYMVPTSCCHGISESQCEKARSIPFAASVPSEMMTSSSIYKEVRMDHVGCARWTYHLITSYRKRD
jgi:hypothetical protein